MLSTWRTRTTGEMEKFSHDLTLALEETSRVRAGHCWGVRRRTRSTGNLRKQLPPSLCEDFLNFYSLLEQRVHRNQRKTVPAVRPMVQTKWTNATQIQYWAIRTIDKISNWHWRHDNHVYSAISSPIHWTKTSVRPGKWHELNEKCVVSKKLHFSIFNCRPNTRRKRKFKRMAVEYETTPSTPGTSNAATLYPIVSNSVKKRVMKHTSQENFRANLFFCGKRKRSHRDRYHDYEHYRLHSSSVPRQRDFFTPKNSYLEYKNRNRASYSKQCERILPLNKTIISKIEKISQDSSSKGDGVTSADTNRPILGFQFDSTCLSERSNATESPEIRIPSRVFTLQADDVYKCSALGAVTAVTATLHATQLSAVTSDIGQNQLKLATKSGSFESTFGASTAPPPTSSIDIAKGLPTKLGSTSAKDGSRRHHTHSHHKQKQSKRLQMKMQLQFDDPNGMDCGNLNDFLSSSSLSSSDSEAAETNESDREGDDELTDWPGNEAMVNFASKNDFKRAKPLRSTAIKPMLPQIKGVNDESMVQDDDTLMSADDLPISPNAAAATMYTGTASMVPLSGLTSSSSTMASSSSAAAATAAVQIPPGTLHLPVKFAPASVQNDELLAPPTRLLSNTNSTSMPIDIAPNLFHSSSGGAIVESEMSGETSNHFLSSPSIEVREIRAGCRRIRDERPGFTIFSSVNEHLSRLVYHYCVRP